MKKLFSKLMLVAMATMAFVACTDVPEPYPMPDQPKSNDGSLPYESANLNSGWKIFSVTPDQPWSLGSSYVQATGYQKWDGADQKSNRAVEGWLVSPEFNTTQSDDDTRSDMKVKLSFDYTIKYTNNVQGWEDFHKVFVTKNYDGQDPTKADWVELDFTPVASPYASNDWTLYPSGEIQLPDEMCNQENIRVGFWFKAPETSSTTWEIKNFKIEEGEATESGDNGNVGTKEEPLSVGDAIAKGTGTGAWVKGFIVGYVDGKALTDGARFDIVTAEPAETNVLIAAAADETDLSKCMPVQLPTGKVRDGVNLKANPGNFRQEVLLHGDIDTYFAVAGLKNTDYAKIGDKEYTASNSTDPVGEAKGDGTLQNPFNPVGAIKYAQSLGADITSDKDVYIKGVISKIANKGTFAESGTYGNATFYISEDGSSTDEFYVFRTLYLGNKQWVTGQTDIKVGDEVIICGKVVNYKGNTPETSGSNSYLYSLNGKTEAETQQTQEVGSIDNPISVPDALRRAEALGDNETSVEFFYIRGYVTEKANTEDEIGPNSSKKYKDMNYYIADMPAGSNVQLYVYRGKYLDGADFTSWDQINQGDEVIIYGQLQKYIDTKNNNAVVPEVKGSKIVKLNGEGGNGNNNQGGNETFTPETGDNGTFESWTNGVPDNWKTASSAGNASLSQDRDAHGGDYAVRVGGSTSGNKRLGYRELKLRAGTYHVSFYAKAMGEGASVNPGYVPIKTDGSAGTYKYSGYVDNVSTREWQHVEADVTIDSNGTYSFVIMNQKKESAIDVLIDDFTVTLGQEQIIK